MKGNIRNDQGGNLTTAQLLTVSAWRGKRDNMFYPGKLKMAAQ